jgi:2-keto-3-deoxy-L-rhamnonate aldolase RhmA
MFGKNRLLEMLQRKEIPLGMQCFTGHPAIIDILGLTGFDFVMLDGEHSPTDIRKLEDLIRASERAGLVPFVRVPDANNATVPRACSYP